MTFKLQQNNSEVCGGTQLNLKLASAPHGQSTMKRTLTFSNKHFSNDLQLNFENRKLKVYFVYFCLKVYLFILFLKHMISFCFGYINVCALFSRIYVDILN